MNIFLSLLMWLIAVIAPTINDGIIGADIFNTGAFNCTAEKKTHNVEWINEGDDKKIYIAKLWTGASGGTVADIGAMIYRVRGESISFHENWDHYAEPTKTHISELNLSPNYMIVKNGDTLKFFFWCQQFNEPLGQAHFILTIFSQ